MLLLGYFCTFIFAVIPAEMIRKMNKYVSLDMLLFSDLSCAIEKCLKFGSMQKNMKHSINFFRKVAAPTGQNSLKKNKSLQVENFFKSILCIRIDKIHHVYSNILYFGQNSCI